MSPDLCLAYQVFEVRRPARWASFCQTGPIARRVYGAPGRAKELA